MVEQTDEHKSVFRAPDRAEKGSALTLIAEETRVRNDKTERLRQLRLARDAAEQTPPPPVKAKPVRKRKTAA